MVCLAHPGRSGVPTQHRTPGRASGRGHRAAHPGRAGSESASGREDGGAGDPGAAEAAVAVGVLGQVLLVVVLPAIRRRGDLRRDQPRPQGASPLATSPSRRDDGVTRPGGALSNSTCTPDPTPVIDHRADRPPGEWPPLGVDVVRRGHALGPGGALVAIETPAGETVGVLHHVVKHSEGFAWGYQGSGPAELARFLLIAVLGSDALCRHCAGTTVVGHSPDSRSDEPYDTARHDPETAGRCPYCDRGIGLPPRLYQRFKNPVVARWPQDTDWHLATARSPPGSAPPATTNARPRAETAMPVVAGTCVGTGIVASRLIWRLSAGPNGPGSSSSTMPTATLSRSPRSVRVPPRRNRVRPAWRPLHRPDPGARPRRGTSPISGGSAAGLWGRALHRPPRGDELSRGR